VLVLLVDSIEFESNSHHLYLSAEKYIFEQPMVEYISLIFLEGCVEMYPVKVRGVKDWPMPRN